MCPWPVLNSISRDSSALGLLQLQSSSSWISVSGSPTSLDTGSRYFGVFTLSTTRRRRWAFSQGIVEIIVTVTFVYIPARLLDISNEGAVLISTMVVLFNSFSHANLRINFGPLRWILVSPQSHRVHHSSEPRHFNRNYGAVLSIWDHFFRIAWHDKSEYPPTGILDPRFPLEERSRAITAIRFYLRQLVYPFTSLRQVQPKSQ